MHVFANIFWHAANIHMQLHTHLDRNRKYVKLFALRKSDFVFFACLVCKQCLDLVCLCSWGGKRSNFQLCLSHSSRVLYFLDLLNRTTYTGGSVNMGRRNKTTTFPFRIYNALARLPCFGLVPARLHTRCSRLNESAPKWVARNSGSAMRMF